MATPIEAPEQLLRTNEHFKKFSLVRSFHLRLRLSAATSFLELLRIFWRLYGKDIAIHACLLLKPFICESKA